MQIKQKIIFATRVNKTPSSIMMLIIVYEPIITAYLKLILRLMSKLVYNVDDALHPRKPMWFGFFFQCVGVLVKYDLFTFLFYARLLFTSCTCSILK